MPIRVETIEVKAFEKGGKTNEEIFDWNLAHAKSVILDMQQEFQPTVFVLTKHTLFYVLLSTKVASATKSSPMDQVEPLIKQFLETQDKTGEVEAYQVIGEAWSKAFHKQSTAYKTLAYGDISKMAARVELLMEVVIRKGMDKRFRTFQIEREINGEKAVGFKKQPSALKMESTKFPIIPKLADSWSGKI
jgi:hypothetical protein